MVANLAEVSIPMPANPADRAQQALAAAEARQIVTAEDYAVAAAELQAIKGKWKEIETSRDSLQKPIREAAARIQAFFKPPLSFLEQAEKILKAKLSAWDKEQERKRLEEQRRLDELARQERLKKEAEAREAERVAREKAEAARKEADAKRQAEEKARREAEEARRRGEREAAEKADRLAREAAAAAAKLDTKAAKIVEQGEQKAATLQAAAAMVVAPVIQTQVPKVTGLADRDNWKAEVTDLRLLVFAVAGNLGRDMSDAELLKHLRAFQAAPLAYLLPNDKVLGQQARSLKEHCVIPGVRVWNDKTKAAISA